MFEKQRCISSSDSAVLSKLIYWTIVFIYFLILIIFLSLSFLRFYPWSEQSFIQENSAFTTSPLKVVPSPSPSNITLYSGVIVKPHSGIGNQLFIYACSYGLAREKGWPLYLFVKHFGGRKFRANQRDFALDQFHVPLENLINSTLIKLIPAHKLETVDDETLFYRNLKGNATFVQHKGYCQSEQYWVRYKDEINELFQLRKNPVENNTQLEAVLESIKNTESVAVHVRRGDFLSANFHVPIAYQRVAIRRIIKILLKRSAQKSPTFFVFSEDISFALGRLSDFHDKYPFVYVSSMQTTSIQDFYLMTQCKHIIFPDSTFSWWAAYLNKNKDKIVIASAFNPKFFTRSGKSQKFDVSLHGTMYHPSSWIVIDPFSGEQ